MTPEHIKKLIETGAVTVNHTKMKAHHRLAVGDEVVVTWSDEEFSQKHIEAEEIDRINILQATWKAMVNARVQLKTQPHWTLVDGLRVPPLGETQTAIIGGDYKSFSIAAASVIAKVTRDRLMKELDCQYPGYGLAQHKGYGTKSHLEALRKLGPCSIHRRSFKPVRLVCEIQRERI